MAETTVIIPRVHLNGTSREELVDQIRRALDALSKADDALAYMSPNGRDYYPLGDSAINTAIEQHRRRRLMLVEIRNEIGAIGEGIVDQVDNRNRLSGARS